MSRDEFQQAFLHERVARRMAQEPLAPPEVRIFIQYKEAFAGKRVLDIGVGSGRTTRYLLPFADDYLGTDISPAMLEVARTRFETARFLQSDMRELIELDEPPFDFALIAYNTIDLFEHETRQMVLASVHGRLAPDGVLVLSTHNRAWTRAGRPPRPANISSVADFPKWVYQLARSGRERVNFTRVNRRRVETAAFAMYPGGYRYSGLVHYTDRLSFVEELAANGFRVLATFDADGEEILGNDLARHSYNLHAVCRRT